MSLRIIIINAIIRFRKLIFLSVGGLFIYISRRLYSMPPNLDTIKNLPTISVNELLKNKGKFKNKEILLQSRIDYSEPSYLNIRNLMGIFSQYNFSNYDGTQAIQPINGKVNNFANPRIGFIEKENILAELLTLYFYNAHHYLLHNDQVLVYGVYKKNRIFYDFDPFIIFQGNKTMLLQYIKETKKYYKKIEIIGYFMVFIVLFKEIIRFLRLVFLKKYRVVAENLTNEKCSKCKIHISNVVQLTCNHFSLCYICFEMLNRKCPLCSQKVDNFYVLK